MRLCTSSARLKSRISTKVALTPAALLTTSAEQELDKLEATHFFIFKWGDVGKAKEGIQWPRHTNHDIRH
jgi:hypothetical protein